MSKMVNDLLKKNVRYYSSSPTLNTVIMVEKTLESMNESIVKVSNLKKMLPKQINHNTLLTILDYLEKSNKIDVSIKGITWIHNTNSNLRDAVQTGLEL